MTMASSTDHPHPPPMTIVILGGGPGGIVTFRRVAHALTSRSSHSSTPIHLVLVNDKDSTFNTVATPRAVVDSTNAPIHKLVYPLSELVDTTAGPDINNNTNGVTKHVLVGTVRSVNTDTRQVTLHPGTGDADRDPNSSAPSPSVSSPRWLASSPPPSFLYDVQQHCITYSHLVIAVGSSYPWPFKPPVGMSTTDIVSSFPRVVHTMNQPAVQRVVVVGIGLVGIEVAGDIKTDYPDKSVTLVGPSVLPGFPPQLADQARRVLKKKGIVVIENAAVDMTVVKGAVAAAASAGQSASSSEESLRFPLFTPNLSVPLLPRTAENRPPAADDKNNNSNNNKNGREPQPVPPTSVVTDCVIMATGVGSNWSSESSESGTKESGNNDNAHTHAPKTSLSSPFVVAGSGVPVTKQGFILVDRTLQVKGHTCVFALGDVIEFPDPGVGKLLYNAAEQAKIVADNVVALVKAASSSGTSGGGISTPAVKLKQFSAPKMVAVAPVGRDASIGYLPVIGTRLGIGAAIAKSLKCATGGVKMIHPYMHVSLYDYENNKSKMDNNNKN